MKNVTKKTHNKKIQHLHLKITVKETMTHFRIFVTGGVLMLRLNGDNCYATLRR